jgi:hypothetical protein
MRELVLLKLQTFIQDSGGFGIPRFFDCDEDEFITDAKELESMSDQELLEVFESCVGFNG